MDAIQDLKLGKEYKYIILNLSKDNSQIIVEKIKSRKPKVEEIDAGPKAGAEAKAGGEVNVSGTNAGKLPVENKSEKELYEEFVEELPETDCRWIVYDFVYEKEGGLRKKLILISWRVIFFSNMTTGGLAMSGFHLSTNPDIVIAFQI